jgi:hypothetical protein
MSLELAEDINSWLLDPSHALYRYDMTLAQNKLIQQVTTQRLLEVSRILKKHYKPEDFKRKRKRSRSYNNHHRKLLQQYVGYESGLTNYSAGLMADQLGTCYWRRCTDLKRLGYIEATGEVEYVPTTRGKQMRNRITEAGLEALEAQL